jgi:hypothetical protein
VVVGTGDKETRIGPWMVSPTFCWCWLWLSSQFSSFKAEELSNLR